MTKISCSDDLVKFCVKVLDISGFFDTVCYRFIYICKCIDFTMLSSIRFKVGHCGPDFIL